VRWKTGGRRTTLRHAPQGRPVFHVPSEWSLNLDRLPDPERAQISGTDDPRAGVSAESRLGDLAHGSRGRARRSGRPWWVWVACALAAFSVLGQGEDCRVDARFISPSATLSTYWTALRDNDLATVYDCFTIGRHDMPFEGMLWFLPEKADLRLSEFRSLPVTGGRVMVSYEVHYRAPGAAREESFQTGSELVRTRGEWRIARPLGEASMPEWHAVPRPVDI